MVLVKNSTDSLDRFHPLVKEWFTKAIGEPTEVQSLSWPAISEHKDILISAPTGSGKTLAAFLACIDRLLSRSAQSLLLNEIDTLYVSPLKALSNDIKKNLEQPLAELQALAEQNGMALPKIQVASRTGDTPQSERQKILRKPPHILVTTPESLYLMLTSKKARLVLTSINTVIVDEIHAMANDKRGAHLALSLERLESTVVSSGRPPPNRVGISATQNPIEIVGGLLVGAKRKSPTIVQCGHLRPLDIAIEETEDELAAVASADQSSRIYDRIAVLVKEHQSTIVFANTRRLVERVSHALEERLGEDQIVAHHGSLSKRIRLNAEHKLKSGNVKCAVATASLELGIDVGSVDLVIQLGSTRSIATFLQRIGRAGHSVHKIPKGRIFALTRDEQIEAAALIRAIRSGRLDKLVIPPEPLDVLAQQIVAETASREETTEDSIFELFKKAYHYRNLSRDTFDSLIRLLSEGTSQVRGRAKAHLHRDQVHGILRPRKGARLAAITCGGSIPDNFNYPVVVFPEETPVGTLDEDFAIESTVGDIFSLGNMSWRVRRVESTRVLVEDARGARPNIPFWFGEAPARTKELSAEVSRLRKDIEMKINEGESKNDIATWLSSLSSMPLGPAKLLVDYLNESKQVLGAIPSQDTLIAERFFDEAGGMQLVIHSPFGGRINKAWGLALRKKFCRSFNLELQAAATDDGIVISLGPPHSFDLIEVFKYVTSKTAKNVLSQATLDAPVFGTRWRWVVSRALAVLRRNAGKKVPPQIMRMRTDDLLSTVFPMQQACLENVVGDIDIPDHPLVFETMRDCLTEFMDVDGLQDVLRKIETGDISILAKDTVSPSPICHELLTANPYAFLDEAPLEERRTRAVYMPRALRSKEEQEFCAMTEETIQAVESQTDYSVDNQEELHDVLLSLMLLEAKEGWRVFYTSLANENRATQINVDNTTFWIATEKVHSMSKIWPDIAFPKELLALNIDNAEAEATQIVTKIVRAHLETRGPTTAKNISATLKISQEHVLQALGTLETEGSILKGAFSQDAIQNGMTEVCDKRMLQRIHRSTIKTLRKSIKPVSAQSLMRFLFRWQRVGQSAKHVGPQGFLEVIEQLQGFESAAVSWEEAILPSRMADYQPNLLDMACFSGDVSWSRLSPKAIESNQHLPTKAAPMTLMKRQDQSWLRAPAAVTPAEELSEHANTVLNNLKENGASFLPDVSEQTGLSARDIQNALWELAGVGLATADGFSSMRLLIQKRGALGSRFDSGQSYGKIQSSKWRRALNRSRRADGRRKSHASVSNVSASGRWSAISPPNPEKINPELHAKQLLKRYGIVFKDLLFRETALPPWIELLRAFRRLEARGTIRGGRFVSGFIGEQYALPEVVKGLRQLDKLELEKDEHIIISATDPLNLAGITSPGAKVKANTKNKLLYVNGLLWASLEGGKINRHPSCPPNININKQLKLETPWLPSTNSIPLSDKRS